MVRVVIVRVLQYSQSCFTWLNTSFDLLVAVTKKLDSWLLQESSLGAFLLKQGGGNEVLKSTYPPGISILYLCLPSLERSNESPEGGGIRTKLDSCQSQESSFFVTATRKNNRQSEEQKQEVTSSKTREGAEAGGDEFKKKATRSDFCGKQDTNKSECSSKK